MLSYTRAPRMGLLGALLIIGLTQAPAWASSASAMSHPCPPPPPSQGSSTSSSGSGTDTASTSTSSTTTTTEGPAGRVGSAGTDSVVRHSPVRYLDDSAGTHCPPPGHLPFTGANSLPMLGAGLGLVAAGAVGVWAARRVGAARSR